METNLYPSKDKYLRDDPISENVTIGLDKLINQYMFSMQTISIFTKIDVSRLNDFYSGKDGLTYDELNLIMSIILLPFMGAIDAAIHNYKAIMKSKGSTEVMVFTDDED